MIVGPRELQKPSAVLSFYHENAVLGEKMQWWKRITRAKRRAAIDFKSARDGKSCCSWRQTSRRLAARAQHARTHTRPFKRTCVPNAESRVRRRKFLLRRRGISKNKVNKSAKIARNNSKTWKIVTCRSQNDPTNWQKFRKSKILNHLFKNVFYLVLKIIKTILKT